MGERVERGADLIEAEADLLRDTDERDASDRVAGEAALTTGRARRLDEPLGFVEAQRGGRDARAPAQRADGELLLHPVRVFEQSLDFK